MTPTTLDRLLDGRVLLEQPRSGFRATIDAVLLAAALEVPAGSTVLDAGCGTGAASLCLAWRRPELRVVGLEVDAAMAMIAAGNARRNGLEATVRIVTGDLLAPPTMLKQQRFAGVMTNPPFHAAAGRPAGDATRTLAMADRVGPKGWITACLRRLDRGGRFVLIYRADRLPELRAASRSSLCGRWPTAGRQSAFCSAAARAGAGARSWAEDLSCTALQASSLTKPKQSCAGEPGSTPCWRRAEDEPSAAAPRHHVHCPKGFLIVQL